MNPIIIVAIVVAVMIAFIVLAIFMMRRWFRPNVQINPESRQEAEATVTRVSYQGSASVGVGFVSRQRPLFGVTVEVQGVGRMRARIILPDESGWDMGNSFRSMGRMFGGDKPYLTGDIVRVEYDSNKPKRCNILTPIRQMQQQMHNQHQAGQMNFDPQTGQPL